MTGYLIFVGILFAIVAIGLAYAFTSDFVDNFTPQYTNGILSSYNDADSDYFFNALMFIFKYFLVPSLLILAFYAWTKAQKPEQGL